MAESALIIFDIDGTLLQTELVTTPAVQRTFASYGLPEPDSEAIHTFFGRPTEEYERWLASLCPPGRALEIIEATNRLEIELIGAEGRLYPGVRDMLTGLRNDGRVLGICSNGPDRYVNEFLDAHDVRRFFDIIRTRGTTYEGKVDMVREILATIPARPAIVVGDRRDDIHAAHVNGALAIGACYGFGTADELASADAKAESAIQIPDAIRQLIHREGTKRRRRRKPPP